jgi:hypothetical protein
LSTPDQIRSMLLIILAVIGFLAVSAAIIASGTTAQSVAGSEMTPETTAEAASISPRLIPQLTVVPIPSEGPVRILVQLDVPPLAVVMREHESRSLLSPAELLAAAEAVAAVGESQRKLIETLSAEPFNARAISSVQLVANVVTFEVDASMVPRIRALDGVKSVDFDRPAFPQGLGAPGVVPPSDPSTQETDQ